jgi:hypothetical protein
MLTFPCNVARVAPRLIASANEVLPTVHAL